MATIQVFDPALCCSTGVCGVDTDQALITFAADVDWAKQNGAQIERFNLAKQPTAFADNAMVKGFLERSGQEALPLILVNGDIALAGRYPNRTELARWAGVNGSRRSAGLMLRRQSLLLRAPMKFLKGAPRFLFFTGKGGVGKTSIACATAIQLAETGRRVLLVSTDPASNVGQVLGVEIGNKITAIPAVSHLFALEIDPEAAAQAYRDRIVGPVRGKLPEAVVKGIEEQLSGACTTEIAAFDEFTALLTDTEITSAYDHIVFDTAPTGHTIRLLQSARRVEWLSRSRKRRRFVPWSARGPRKAARAVQCRRASPRGWSANTSDPRRSRPEFRPARGGAHPWRTDGNRPHPAIPCRQWPFAERRGRARSARQSDLRTRASGLGRHA